MFAVTSTMVIGSTGADFAGINEKRKARIRMSEHSDGSRRRNGGGRAPRGNSDRGFGSRGRDGRRGDNRGRGDREEFRGEGRGGRRSEGAGATVVAMTTGAAKANGRIGAMATAGSVSRMTAGSATKATVGSVTTVTAEIGSRGTAAATALNPTVVGSNSATATSTQVRSAVATVKNVLISASTSLLCPMTSILRIWIRRFVRNCAVFPRTTRTWWLSTSS